MTAAYDSWSREDLIQRVKLLESTLQSSVPSTHPQLPSKPHRLAKPFDFRQYARRKIALKFCYSGWEYGGLAFQSEPTPLPTVESVLLDALRETRLIDSEGGMEGCGWSRCGRTDRGVSAAGQVVALYVRSAVRPVEESQPIGEAEAQASDSVTHRVDNLSLHPSASNAVQPLELDSGVSMTLEDFEPFGPSPSTKVSRTKHELNYVDILNRVLPPTIRILAWSPVSSEFDARFSCTFRHYKYFFDPLGLDLDLMRDATERLIGEHDFRNLCKVDPSKQITNYTRHIKHASISNTSSNNDIYVLDVIGNGFLYHQIRHIMAILFLVGGGFESPSIVTSLLNVSLQNPYPPFRSGEPAPAVVDRKPQYAMADGLPLVLWDCGHSDEDISWQFDPETDPNNGPASELHDMRDASSGPARLLQHLESIRQGMSIKAELQRHFIQASMSYQTLSLVDAIRPKPQFTSRSKGALFQIPSGGGVYRRTGRYVPLLERERNDTVEVTNERWRLTKGMKKAQKAITEDD